MWFLSFCFLVFGFWGDFEIFAKIRGQRPSEKASKFSKYGWNGWNGSEGLSLGVKLKLHVKGIIECKQKTSKRCLKMAKNAIISSQNIFCSQNIICSQNMLFSTNRLYFLTVFIVFSIVFLTVSIVFSIVFLTVSIVFSVYKQNFTAQQLKD